MDRPAPSRKSKSAIAFQINEGKLLTHLVPVFLEVVETFASSYDAVVQDGQRDKDPAFHGRFANDLRDLGNAIQVSSTLPAGGAEERKRTTDNLLHQFQKSVDSGSPDSEEDLKRTVPVETRSYQGHYDLRVLLSRLWSEEHRLDSGARASWLCERVHLRDVEEKRQSLLLQLVKECRKTFSVQELANLGKSLSSGSGSNAEWLRASHFCSHLKQLHDTLTQHWECRCVNLHKSARFSFRVPCSTEADSANLSLFFPCRDRNDPVNYAWKLVKIKFTPICRDGAKLTEELASLVDSASSQHRQSSHMNGSPAGNERDSSAEHDSGSAVVVKVILWREIWPICLVIQLWHLLWLLRSSSRRASNHFVDDVEPVGQNPPQPEPWPGQRLCSQLEQRHDGRCIELVTNENGFGVSDVAEETDHGANTMASHKMVKLADVLEDPPRYNSPTNLERFTLALLLAYAYYHFAGGSWWPYGPSEDWTEKIFFFVRSNCSETTIDEPFLAFDTAQEQSQPKLQLSRDGLAKMSLTAFGKLLLELAVSRRVPLERVDAEVTQYQNRPRFFSSRIAGAIKFCTAPDSGLLSADQLKREFAKRVIFTLQHVMVEGGCSNLDLFFQRKADEALRRASLLRADREIHTFAEPNVTIQPENSHEDSREEKTFTDCLHGDTHKVEKDPSEKTMGAARWLDDLQRWRYSARKHGFLSEEQSNGLEPVKIAVLDTGTKLAQSLKDRVYKGRLKEIRTWCRKGAQEDGEELADGEDSDGHGTHSVSLVLEATRGTSCQVYVAQVFQDSNDKCNDPTEQRTKSKRKYKTSSTAQAIAWALRHAVNKWEVDVISMSFGFRRPVPVIEKAIDHARNQSVLMFASASNSGGNTGLAWPASHEHVICIHATDNLGNPYRGNPTPTPDQHELAILGECVRGWAASGEENPSQVERSGTSSATPIAASVAAVLLNIMLHRKAGYVADVDPKKQRAQEEYYDERLGYMRQPAKMWSVLKMIAGDTKRQEYYYVSPWEYLKFDEVEKPDTLIENILKRLI